MNPAELFSFREPRWFENLMRVAFLTSLVATGFVALALNGGEQSILGLVGLMGAFLSMIAGAGGGFLLIFRYEVERRLAVFNRLEPLDTSRLVALCGSAEVNEYNRSLVKDFLNERRPGWSFSIGTVNTTAS